MRREALACVEKAPLSSLSAARVPYVGGVCTFADVPAGAERAAAASDERVAGAKQELLAALRFRNSAREELATLAVSLAASWLAGALVAATFLLAGGRLPSRAPFLLVRGMFAGSVCE